MKRAIIFGILFIGMILGCNKTKQTNVVRIDYDSIRAAMQNPYVSCDTNGNVVVINFENDTLFKGNVHDTLKKPCVVCKKKWKGKTLCQRYHDENLRLWKQLQSCKKENYYVPSDSTKK